MISEKMVVRKIQKHLHSIDFNRRRGYMDGCQWGQGKTNSSVEANP